MPNAFDEFDAEEAATVAVPVAEASASSAPANAFDEFDSVDPIEQKKQEALDEFHSWQTESGEQNPDALQAKWDDILTRRGFKAQGQYDLMTEPDKAAQRTQPLDADGNPLPVYENAQALQNALDAKKRVADEAGVIQTVDNVVRSLARGVPVLGAYSDEINAAVNTDIGMGGDYDKALAYERERDRQFDEQHPYLSTGLQIAGGVGGTLAGARLLPAGAAQNVAQMTMREKMLAGAAAGGSLGAVEGYGRGEGNVDKRMQQMAHDTMVNSAIGGAVPLAAPVFSKVWDLVSDSGAALLKKVLPAGEKTAADQLKEMGASGPTVKRLAESLKEDLNTGSYQQAAPGDMLLNRGDRLSAAAETIANSPGEGGSIIKTALRQQQAGEGARVKSVVDDVLGRDAGRVKNAALVDSEKKAAGRMFEAAKSSGVQFDMTAAQQRLAQMIKEADGPVADALRRAQRLKTLRPQEAAKAGPKDAATAADELFPSLAKTSKQAPSASEPKGYTAAEVHATRMALDDLIEKLGQPGTSAGRNAVSALKQVRSMIDDGLKNNVKGWREADEAFSLVMKKRTAMEDGRSVFSRGFGSPDELKAELEAMDPAVRKAFQIGARDAISELMGTARKEANAAARELLDKGWNREKLQVLLGKQNAGKIADTLEAVSRRQAQATRIAGNSRTAAREAEKKAHPVGEAKGANLDAIAQRGVIGNTLRGFGALVDSATNNYFTNRSQRIASETAKMLTAVGIDQEKIASLLEQEAQRLGRKLEAKDVARVIRGAVLGVGVSRGTNSGANLPSTNLLPEL